MTDVAYESAAYYVARGVEAALGVVAGELRALPEDGATQSRDYGRGYAQAIRDALAILDDLRTAKADSVGSSCPASEVEFEHPRPPGYRP